MELYIFLGVMVGAVVIMLLAILISGLKHEKRADNFPQEPAQHTRIINATVLDQYCAVRTIGHQTPKTIKIFTVVFQADTGEIIKQDVPEEMYDGFEKGQAGVLTIVDEDLYSFVPEEDAK